ncbi:hypothetical protein JOB18_021804 [Solea senegalensis]|uniref:Uncharacterized protein n=1 Tax=Solea senegalensis TaxID=28829 RepID=A0AAV6QTD8_SOLSE|nr:hypothetical protein JOB18_021804 [Solea senegalensis]
MDEKAIRRESTCLALTILIPVSILYNSQLSEDQEAEWDEKPNYRLTSCKWLHLALMNDPLIYSCNRSVYISCLRC